MCHGHLIYLATVLLAESPIMWWQLLLYQRWRWTTDALPLSSQYEDDCDLTDDSRHSTVIWLSKWVVDVYIMREDCNGMVANLRRHRSSQIPLNTSFHASACWYCGGKYVYFGPQKCEHCVICCHCLCQDDPKQQLSSDGVYVPLYKSSSVQIWSTSCSVNNSMRVLTALLLGKPEPNSAEPFIGD